MVFRTMAAAAAGYALGTLPSADLVSRAAGGVDPRAVGSGNPGAANVASVMGPAAGFAVLTADIAKGAVAGRVGRRLAGALGGDLAATAAVIGHCYPVWNGFRGGKGVATSVGQVLATFPAYFPIDVAVAVATAAVPQWNQRAFAATTVSSVVWIAGSQLWWRRQLPNLWGGPPSWSLPTGAVVSSLVIRRRFLDAARVRP
jgi:glycerol-3-phosphate acyltransferase PlsY